MKPSFRVGQEVTWTANTLGRPLRCTIVRVMPFENATRTYRVRGAAETFERSVTEDTLTAAGRTERDGVFKKTK